MLCFVAVMVVERLSDVFCDTVECHCDGAGTSACVLNWKLTRRDRRSGQPLRTILATSLQTKKPCEDRIEDHITSV